MFMNTETKQDKPVEEMSKAAREARNAYKRKWARENPEKVKSAYYRYWERKAQEAAANENQ